MFEIMFIKLNTETVTVKYFY